MLLLMSPQPKRWGICSDVSGVIMENLINKNVHKENPPPKITEEDINKDKEESKQKEDK